MLFKAIDPTNKSLIGECNITEMECYSIYKIILRATDYNPSTSEFRKRFCAARPILNEPEWFDAWVDAIAQIKQENENPKAMCYILEDHIEEWRISHFVDASYKIVELSSQITV